MQKTFSQKMICGSVNRKKRLEDRKRFSKSRRPADLLLRARIERMTDALFDRAYEVTGALQADAYVSEEPLPFAKKETGRLMQHLKPGDRWAQHTFDCAWFHVTGKIPPVHRGDHNVYLINIGGEGLIYQPDATPVQAITCYASEYDYTLSLPVKRVVKDFSKDGVIDFWIDAAANDLFGNLKNGARIGELSTAVCHEHIRALAYDVQALISVYDTNPDTEFTLAILQQLSALLQVYPTISDAQAAAYREKLLPLLDQRNKEPGHFQYYAIGHAHLDLAWKWPIRETKRKGLRTFSTQLHNLEKYPDYIFGASQAQLYRWIEEGAPELYQRVKAAVQAGRWEVQGATWVEMDSNLISGESMLRQFYYGKQFFRSEFGLDMKILWLPDSFGYSACLPQVMKLAGVPYFLTQKMSWNTVNKFPYHTFRWQSPDGSEVLAHMLPDETYNGPVTAERMKFGERNYQERKISNQAIMLFGIGDGGAGPGYEHIERMERFRNIEGEPEVIPSKAIDAFQKLDDGTVYPVHQGELYLEKHQGTYTTQSANKFYNRKCEFALRNYELLMLLAGGKAALPLSPERLDALWKEILLYQFHDILPGSSINRVYDESQARYQAIYSEVTQAVAALSSTVFGCGFFNFNSFADTVTVKEHGKWYQAEIPSLGFLPREELNEISTFHAHAEKDVIENDCVKITFENGFIRSFYDKRMEREFTDGARRMAVIAQYRDVGDCWDIRPQNYASSRREARCIGFETMAGGPCATAKGSYRIGDSTVTMDYHLMDHSPALQMELTIDCHQKSRMLRIEFPTSIETDECSFNVPFGHIKRKTTENNSVEKAQYEVSGQKFVDLSCGEYGLSLVNDCKYGFRCKNGVIDVNLIRSPSGGPGHNVDQGVHHIKLALLPHEGGLSRETYALAYQLNNPIYETAGDAASGPAGCYASSNTNIVLESAQLSRDGNGAVLRLYNCSEAAQAAEISFSGYRNAGLTDVMEDTLEPCRGALSFRPFELKLLKIEKIL